MDDIVLERFMRDVRIENGCWVWTRYRTRKRDVSDVWIPGRKGVRPGRWSYDRWCGKLKDDHHVVSMCGNRRCVNPFHLIQCERGIEMWKALGRCPNGHTYNEDRIRFSHGSNGRLRYSCKDCVNEGRKAARRLAAGRKKNANARLS